MRAPSSQSEIVASLRQRLRGWEADGRAPVARFSSGCAAWDGILPKNGFCRGTLVEFLAERGSGATALSLLAAREACRGGRTLIVVDQQRRFYPPAAANVGIDLANTVVVRPRTRKDEWWALHQSLRCPGVGAVLSWPAKLDDRVFRALQLAAENGEAVGLFVRPVGIRGQPTWAAIRLLVGALPTVNTIRRMRIEVLRCRKGQAGASVEVELNDETGVLQESRVVSPASQLAASAAAFSTSGA